MKIREMEDTMSESIPDPAHFFRSHSAYQQLLCVHRTCSSLSESMPTYAEPQSGYGWTLQAYAHWNNHASSCNNHLKFDSHLHVMPSCYLGIKGSKISLKTLQTITSNRIFANIQKCRTHHQVLLFGECSSSPGHVFLLCSPLLFQWWRVLRAMAMVNGQPLTRLPIHRWAWHLGGANHIDLVMKRTVNHQCINMYVEQSDAWLQ